MAEEHPMALKAVVSSLDDVEEAFRPLYAATTVEGEAAFALQIEGFRVHPDALALSNAHERTKTLNRTLTSEVATLKTKLEDVPEDFDAELYQRAVSEGVGGAGEPKDAEQIRREAAEAATTRADAKWKKENDKVVAERDRFKKDLEERVKRAALDEALDLNGFTDVALRRGARALIMPDIEIHEEDGVLTALAKDPVVGDTLPVAEHVKAWAGTDEGKAYRPARESAGSGANGGGSGGNPPNSSDANPWKAGATFNMTRQAQIKNEDPAKADKLMREAGVRVQI